MVLNYSQIEESSEAKDYSNDEVRWLGYYSFSVEIIYKREYLLVYFFVSILTLFLVAFDLFTHDGFSREKKEPTWFIFLDCFCVLLLILEISLRYSATHKNFWIDPFNKFDVCVIIISCVSLSMYPMWTGSDFFGACVLGTRYVAQTSRLLMFLKRWEDRMQAQKSSRKDLIKFDDNEDPEITFLDPSFPTNPSSIEVKSELKYHTYQQDDDADLSEETDLTVPPF